MFLTDILCQGMAGSPLQKLGLRVLKFLIQLFVLMTVCIQKTLRMVISLRIFLTIDFDSPQVTS